MKEENPFILKSSKPIYENPWIKVREDSVIRPGGKEGIFGVVEMNSGVTMVALDVDGFVYLVREYKYALGRYCLECVGGGMNTGEEVLTAAKHELHEEIGGVSDEWSDLGLTDSFNAGIIDSLAYYYLAKDVRIEMQPHPDEGEVLEIVRVPFAEIDDRIMSGEITDGTSIVALLKAKILLNQ